jgi:hypothetical protein
MKLSSEQGFVYKKNLYEMYGRLGENAFKLFMQGERRKGYVAAVQDKKEDMSKLVIVFAVSRQEADLFLQSCEQWSDVVLSDGYISSLQSIFQLGHHLTDLSFGLPLINYDLKQAS